MIGCAKFFEVGLWCRLKSDKLNPAGSPQGQGRNAWKESAEMTVPQLLEDLLHYIHDQAWNGHGMRLHEAAGALRANSILTWDNCVEALAAGIFGELAATKFGQSAFGMRCVHWWLEGGYEAWWAAQLVVRLAQVKPKAEALGVIEMTRRFNLAIENEPAKKRGYVAKQGVQPTPADLLLALQHQEAAGPFHPELTTTWIKRVASEEIRHTLRLQMEHGGSKQWCLEWLTSNIKLSTTLDEENLRIVEMTVEGHTDITLFDLQYITRPRSRYPLKRIICVVNRYLLIRMEPVHVEHALGCKESGAKLLDTFNGGQVFAFTYHHATAPYLTVSHMLTMTNGAGWFETVHRGDRRDLCASVLFFIPVFPEVLLWLGCVDASSATAHHNLRRGRSLLIFVGGEKEQLMTMPGRHQVYVSGRKGFVKLALEYGVPLVPMYTFGENEAYSTSSALMGFRRWLQRTLQLGVPLAWGRWGSFVPLPVPLHVEIGTPVPVGPPKKREDITSQDIDALHAIFEASLRALFDRTKAKHGWPEATLEVY